jgi:two-component system, sensor histidine kinase
VTDRLIAGVSTIRQARGVKITSPSGQRSRFEVPRVLVIEDDDDCRELFASYLESHGLAVMMARNGLEGVEAASRWRPRVIVIDIAMPIMDGWDATRRLRAMPEARGAFIIALTAFTGSTNRRRSLEAGCDVHLTKPIGLANLLAAVMRAIDELAARDRVADDEAS